MHNILSFKDWFYKHINDDYYQFVEAIRQRKQNKEKGYIEKPIKENKSKSKKKQSKKKKKKNRKKKKSKNIQKYTNKKRFKGP